jgi:leucyl aminopeptidase
MKPASSLPPHLALVPRADVAAALPEGNFDALVVVGPAPLSVAEAPAPIRAALAQAERTDRPLAAGRAVGCVPAAGVPGERLVIATTGPLSSWELDVRAVGAAAAAGVARAVDAGARRPLVWLAHAPREPRFAQAREVAALGALAALWRPLELRLREGFKPAADALGWVDDDEAAWARAVDLERARGAARDVAGTEPETMSPAAMGDYCAELFRGGPVEVSVEGDQGRIAAGYPLLAAVARASQPVEAHRPRVIRLAYQGEGEVERTLFFAGKGLVYDTGGADVKTDGHMAGMSRDKGGAGAVVGVFAALAARKPRGVRAVGLLGAVRNSVGPHGYVSDEIITARSGVRVRIGNTDAEGRLVLADLVAALREEAHGRPDPSVFSIATLTGHAALSYGPYTAILENGPARARGLADALDRAGEAFGDPFERSRLRPEDYAFIAGRVATEDVLSCNNLPSSRTPRGHQFPAAFIDVVSGLRAHHAKGGPPIAFAHLDIAGSCVANGTWQTGTPTGAPVVALMHGLSLA